MKKAAASKKKPRRVKRKSDTKRPKSDTGGQLADMSEAVTLAEASGLTGLSERTIRRYVKAGKLPSTKKGRAVYVSRPVLEELTGRKLTGSPRPAPMSDTVGQLADTVTDTDGQVTALAPVLKSELEAIREHNARLTVTVNRLNEQLDAAHGQNRELLAEQRKLLTAGDTERTEAAERLAETSERAAKAEATARVWCAVAAFLGVLLAVFGVLVAVK